MNAPDAVTDFDWRLADVKEALDGPTYVSTFACGGGSSMGYRLAGYRSLGCAEVDKRMFELYQRNLGSKDDYLGDIRRLIKEPQLIPKTWYDVDVLDGSPPCTVFSTARKCNANDRGAKRKYAEGAIEQTLDDLFSVYLDLVSLIRPRVFIAENVTGMLQRPNRWYLTLIKDQTKAIGYDLKVMCLNAATHGLPQIRKRLFFIGLRTASQCQLRWPKRPLVIPRTAFAKMTQHRGGGELLNKRRRASWVRTAIGQHIKGGGFGVIRMNPNRPIGALTATPNSGPAHWTEPRYLTYDECARLQSFPDDYDFGRQSGQYVCGMSVPPFMMRDVAMVIRQAYFS